MSNRRGLRNTNNTFTTNDDHNEVINELKNNSSKKNVEKSNSYFTFWLLTFVFVVVPAVLIARSPIFRWNHKPLKASYIE